MKYRIEHNTPLPPRGAGASRKHKTRKLSIAETIADMPPNYEASFLVPLKNQKPEKIRSKVFAAIQHIRTYSPERVYATRYMEKEKGIRVWRIR